MDKLRFGRKTHRIVERAVTALETIATELETANERRDDVDDVEDEQPPVIETAFKRDNFEIGVKCPQCRSRDTIAHPNPEADRPWDYGCTDCDYEWDDDSEAGTSVVIEVVDTNQPDMVRQDVVSFHLKRVTADEDLADETRFEPGDAVDVIHLVYATGTVSRLVSERLKVRGIGPNH